MRVLLVALLISLIALGVCQIKQDNGTKDFDAIATSTPLLDTSVATTTTAAGSPIRNFTLRSCQNAGQPYSTEQSPGLPAVLSAVYQLNDVYYIGGIPTLSNEISNLLDGYKPIGFSPDGTKFGYFTVGPGVSEKLEIHILTPDGQIQKVELVTGNSSSGVGAWAQVSWIDSQHVLTQFRRQDDPTQVSYAVVNLLSRQWEHNLSDEFPNHYVSTAFVVSPDLTRVLFDSSGAVELWDLTTRERVWQSEEFFIPWLSQGAGNSNVSVVWNSISSHFAFTSILPGGSYSDPNSYRTYVADRNVSQIDIATNYRLLELSWSPDGRYVVGRGENGLEVIDVEQMKRIAVCDIESAREIPSIWSPDGRYIAYERRADDGIRASVEVWDLETGAISRLLEGPGTSIAGWSANHAWLSAAFSP